MTPSKPFVWIDATAPESWRIVWGMTLAERVMRQVAEEGLTEIHLVVGSGRRLDRLIRRDFWKRYPGVHVHPWTDRLGAVGHLVSHMRERGVDALILQGDALYDERLTHAFSGLKTATVACSRAGDHPVLALLTPAALGAIERQVPTTLTGLVRQVEARGTRFSVEDMEPYYRRLRSYQPVYWKTVSNDDDAEAVHRLLKGAVHKGTNDLVAKFIHPPLEFALTRLICRTRIQPNHVTLFNIVLAFSAVPFFFSGNFFTALALALTKGVTDGVDGKLARLTLRTSALGDKLDHVSDVIYPNGYYIAMAFYFSGGDFYALAWLAVYWVVPTYFLDRLVRWLFTRRHGETIQDYRKIDVWFRLVQSNRNISMWTFLLFLLAGDPLWGYYAVVCWVPSNFMYYGLRYVYEFNRTREGVGFDRQRTVRRTVDAAAEVAA